MGVPVIRQDLTAEHDFDLAINPGLMAAWLTSFLRDECIRRRSVNRAVIGLSGGLDSAVTAFLCARAFGPECTFAFLMPYKLSSPDSLTHAQLVVNQLGIQSETIEITAMVDGYADTQPNISPTRIGNICARCRANILFDQSARLGALPIGTGNKTERLMGYFTWHADDSPPINPLGDLYKTQVIALAKELEVPEPILRKPPSADLVQGQTDEGDFGVTYEVADRVLAKLLAGHSLEAIEATGIPKEQIERVNKRLQGTHWKRKLPTVAVISDTAIGEYYLRPVDY